MALGKFLLYMEVSKPKVTLLLVFSGVISQTIALRMGFGRVGLLGLQPLETFAFSSLALTLGILGANAVTCYVDREIDGMMERTKRRPIPSGRISPPEKALYYGLILSLVSLAVLSAINIYSGMWFAFGLVDSTLIYNLLTKRRTAWNIILGSPAGGASAMAGWAAITGQFFHPIPLLLATLIVLWTPAHIWSLAIKYSDDYLKAGVPMFPAQVGFKQAARCIASTTLLLPVFSTLLGKAGGFQSGFYFVAYALNAAIVLLGFMFIFKPSHKNAWLLFKFTSPYLTILLVASAVFSG